MAPSWKPCAHCGQQFGSSSLELHMKRCRYRPEVLAEAQLREEEGWARPKPNADWEQCPNCGEPYGKVAFAGHVAKCRKLRPHGANGFGPGGGGSTKQQNTERMLKKHEGKVDKMRELFDRFDADGDGVLDERELSTCLRQCFPTRSADAEELAYDFKKADKDGSGGVDFEEFVSYYNLLAGSANRFDEASDMFRQFDADRNGVLDKEEFSRLLHQVFPEHCDEVDEIVDEEFKVADADGSGGISFDEFCAYYERLIGLFEAEEEEEQLDVTQELVACDGCQRTFLPDKLEPHRRSCPAVQALEDAKRAKEEAERKLREALAEAEAAKQEAAAAKAKAEADAAASAAQASDAAKAKTAAEAEAARKRKEEAAKAKRERAAAAKAAADKEAADARAAGLTDTFQPTAFVPCPACGRTFFPDRLPVHARACAKRKPSGIRETTTDGAMKGSVYITSRGQYGNDTGGGGMGMGV